MRPCTQRQRLENRMVKTDEVLRTLLGMGFGCVSLNEEMFRGRDCTSPGIPKSYFATDRLGKHPDAPVNRMCATRVLWLIEIGLSGKSKHDACSVSRMLRKALLEMFRVETLDFAYDGKADPMRERKMAAQMAFLRIAMPRRQAHDGARSRGPRTARPGSQAVQPARCSGRSRRLVARRDCRCWRKQRHTATRVYVRLRDEMGYTGSYSTVQRYVRRRKAQMAEGRDARDAWGISVWHGCSHW